MSAALVIDIILWSSVAAVGFVAFRSGPKVLTASLREGAMDFVNIVPRVAVGVIGSGFIAAVIPQEVVTGWLGPTIAWALFAFQRLLLWEIPFMPGRFVWFRAAVSLPFPFLAAAMAMAIGRP